MNSSNLKYILITIVTVVAIYFLLFRSPTSKSGKLAPDSETQLTDGTDFSLSDLRGNYVLLNFWGSWCPPCRKNNPKIVSLYNDYKDKQFNDASGFTIVSIALEKNEKSWKKAVEKDGINWPYQIVQESRLVLSAPLALKYNVSDVPSKFLIGPDGEVIGVNLPETQIRELLDNKLK